jgi:spore coat polysaccharide biosynthesis protein SpsF
MADRKRTDTEELWAGSFGDAYVDRNTAEKLLASNIGLFGEILSHTRDIASLIEFGANVGANLRAISLLRPSIQLSAVEINAMAAGHLRAWGGANVHMMSMLEFVPERRFDCVLTKGVLIHIDPELLGRAYDVLYGSTSRYICLAEYYNPTPVTIPYRGQTKALFKRDFAGEFLARYGDLRLVAYGFAYHGDPNFPQDDLTWFLLERVGQSDR